MINFKYILHYLLNLFIMTIPIGFLINFVFNSIKFELKIC